MTASSEDDDDFTRLENNRSPVNPDTSLPQYLEETSTAMAVNNSQPFLPRSAEAELYQLATNFLLYVAMVLIITLVAKIYFPEAVRARTQTGNPPRVRLPSSPYSYQPVTGQEDTKNPNNYNDKHNDNTDVAATADAAADDDDNDDHDDDDDDDDKKHSTEKLFEFEPVIPDPKNTETNIDIETQQQSKTNKKKQNKKQNKQKKQKKKIKKKRLNFNAPMPHLSNVFLFESNVPSSRSSILKRLAFCAISLNVTFVAWGLLQERMLTRRYPRYTGEYFTYSYALVFTNRFWTLILSGLLLLYLKPQRSQTTVIYEYSFPSISNMLSSWCQYESLKYVSFPAATLFKSFKLAPVMLMGVVLGNKKYPNYDYLVALLIGIGITLFMSSTDDLKVSFRYNTYEQQDTGGDGAPLLQHTDGAVWTGVMLLLFFLFFDSFTSQWQSRMFQRHVDLSMVELIFATSAYSALLSFITLVHTNELIPAIQFMYRHSEIHVHFFIFSICSTIGQLLIYYTIKNFGAVVFTIIMTIRILTSIALSVILYDHHVTTAGFFGLVTVMGAIGYRIKRQAESSNLIKWKGMDDHKAFALVREWHEHVDM